MLLYVLATVTFVLVLAQHIIVQQVILFVQIQLLHVTVQVVAQYLIVRRVLILMVYADIQHVAVILAAMHTIMVLPALPVKLVAVALALRMSQLAALASIALLHTIVATVLAAVLPLAQQQARGAADSTQAGAYLHIHALLLAAHVDTVLPKVQYYLAMEVATSRVVTLHTVAIYSYTRVWIYNIFI